MSDLFKGNDEFAMGGITPEGAKIIENQMEKRFLLPC